MKLVRPAILLASFASIWIAFAASAQTTPPPGPNDGDPALHGTGATSSANVIVELIDWMTANQPFFDANYLPAGSGTGKNAWRNTTPQLGPFGSPFSGWYIVQFGFSESSVTLSDILAYNKNVQRFGGSAIVVPQFVLPIAIAYNPVYAKNSVSGTEYRFNVQAPQALPDAITGLPKVVGGLRLSRAAYCGIFNGTIRNWNDGLLTILNGGVSLRDPADANWGVSGIPIRLVGRLDKSGATDIFTRALAAQCPGGSRITTNAEALPFDPTLGTAPDFTGVRIDTPYRPGGAGFAGPTNAVGNQYFNRTTGSIQSVSGGVPSQPAGVGNGTGLFLLADGSAGVSAAIAADPDIGTSAYKVNGKIGYIGSDYIANAKGASPKIFTAALSRPSATGTFLLPSAANATNAFAGILPPQSASTGAFQVVDTRLVRSPTGGVKIPATRDNPFAWHDVLYPTPASGLASPSAGYPITGTTQILLNTCYKATNQPHIVKWVGYNMGTPTTVFTNSTTGILAKSNIAAVSDDWKRAIIQTFLVNSNETNSGQRLGDLDLWIETAQTTGADHCNVGTLSGSPGM
ncbi:PBP domain containing protein [Sphingobium cupriresistens]